MVTKKNEQWYREIYRYGISSRSQIFSGYALKRRGDSVNIGVVIPNAVIPLASQRNLVKRRVVWLVHHYQLVKPGVDYVVSIRRNVVKLPMPQLINELRQLLQKLSKDTGT